MQEKGSDHLNLEDNTNFKKITGFKDTGKSTLSSTQILILHRGHSILRQNHQDQQIRYQSKEINRHNFRVSLQFQGK